MRELNIEIFSMSICEIEIGYSDSEQKAWSGCAKFSWIWILEKGRGRTDICHVEGVSYSATKDDDDGD